MGPLSNWKAVAHLAACNSCKHSAAKTLHFAEILEPRASVTPPGWEQASCGWCCRVQRGCWARVKPCSESRAASCPSLLHQSGSASQAQLLQEEGSDPAMLQCLVAVNRGLFRNQLPLTWIHPSAEGGSGGLSVTTLQVNVLQTPEVQVFQYTWVSILPIQT